MINLYEDKKGRTKEQQTIKLGLLEKQIAKWYTNTIISIVTFNLNVLNNPIKMQK